jgi:AraC-like DNA-binding protein
MDTFHAHWGMELLWIHPGEGALISGRSSYPIRPHTLCLLPPFHLHHVKLEVELQPDIVRSFFLFEPNVFESHFEQLPLLYRYFQFVCREQGVVCLSGLPENHALLQILDAHFQRLEKGSPEQQMEDNIVFLLAFFRCLQEHESDAANLRSVESTGKLNQIAERIMQWVEDHYAESFQLNRMAHELHLSPYHLSHVFTEATGTTISQYVKARRVQQACRLLNSGSMPITAVAEAVGLTKLSYFCKIFKELIGITPHQYRLRIRRYE